MNDVSVGGFQVSTRDQKFFGKYRGNVVNNADPEGRGRLQVSVPEVRGANVIDWALPAMPFAGDGVGFFALPPVDAMVWVEYEGGNLRYPIWSGCFWQSGQIAAADAVPGVTFIKTQTATLRIDDNTGEIRIEIGATAITLTASETKIESPQITNSAGGGQTQLTAAGFDAQQGALKVM